MIDVHPGPNAITKAIAAADAGDTLRIHRGTYHEAVTVDKPLRLESTLRGPRPIVDAGCKANDTIHVTSGGVTIAGLDVEGAASGFGDYPAEIFFEGARSGTVIGNIVYDTCDAEYGISAFATGPLHVAQNLAVGFDDSGIYVGTITDTRGKVLRVTQNSTIKSSRGIIVEDSNLPAAHILISHNVLNRNRIAGDEGPSDGLFLTNSDHVRVHHNIASGNAGSGYHANSSSDHNVFTKNVAKHDHDGKLLDEGRANCGSQNNFPIPAC